MTKDQEKQEYLQSISGHSDRELLELQTWYAAKSEEHLETIRIRVRFFYVLAILGLIVLCIWIYSNIK